MFHHGRIRTSARGARPALLAVLFAVLAQLFLAPACAIAMPSIAMPSKVEPVADCHPGMAGAGHARHTDDMGSPAKAPAQAHGCSHCLTPPPVVAAEPVVAAPSPPEARAPEAQAAVHEAPSAPSPAAPPPSQGPPSPI